MGNQNPTSPFIMRARGAFAALLLAAPFSVALPVGADAQSVPVVTVTVDGPKAEGEFFTFTVSRTGGNTFQHLDVNLEIKPGSAVAADIGGPAIVLFEIAGIGRFIYPSLPGGMGVPFGQDLSNFRIVPGLLSGFRIPAGMTERTFQIQAFDDSSSEGEESFTVELKTGAGYTFTTNLYIATATILASDRPGISVSPAQAPEGDPVMFRVSLSQATTEQVTVDFATELRPADTHPAVQADFTATSQTVTFAAGETSKMVSVPTIEDTEVEAHETFTARLSNPSGGLTLTRDAAVGTIENDDVITVSLSLPSANRFVDEGGTVEFEIRLEGATAPWPLRMTWSVVDSREDVNLEGIAPLVETGANAPSGTVLPLRVPVLDDGLAEGAETFTVRLNSSVTVSLGIGLSLEEAQAINAILAAGVRVERQMQEATATIRASDPATISIEDASGSEEDGGVEFTATLSGGRLPQVTAFRWSRGTGSGFSAEDEDLGNIATDSNILSFRAGSQAGDTVTFTVPVVDDDLAEGPETFRVTLSAPPRFPPGGSPYSLPGGVSLGPAVTGTIEESDPVMVSISGRPSVAEGGTAEFTVSWTGSNLPSGVSAAYEIDIADPITADDFTSVSGTVPLLEGDARQTTFMVETASDGIVEGDETFTVRLVSITAPQGAVRLTDITAARGTIENDDTATVSVSDARGPEGESFDVTVTLSTPAASSVSVDYTISPDTADSPADFTVSPAFPSGTVVIPAGTTTGTISVTTVEDTMVEGPETFTVTLSAPSSGFPDGVSLDPAATTATGTIVDDDTPTVSISDSGASGPEGGDVVFTLTLRNADLMQALMVDWSVSFGTGTHPAQARDIASQSMRGTVTFPSTARIGDTQTITVTTVDDDIVEGAETFTVTLDNLRGEPLAGLGTSSATGTIMVDSSDTATVSVSGGTVAEGQPVPFTATLSPAAELDVTVNWATSVASGDTAVQADFMAVTDGTLTIAAGTTETVTVATVDDDEVEGAETFTVTLTLPSGAPDGVTLDPTATTAQGTILASDQPVSISIAGPDAPVSEGGTARFTVTVTASDPVPEIAVDWAASVASGDTAEAEDFTAASGQLTFAATSELTQTRTIDVPVVDDALAEGDETFTVTLSAPSSGFPGGVSLVTSSAMATIDDDDTATVSIAGARAVEGRPVRFTVRLSDSPGSDVVVNYATSVESGDTAESGDFTAAMGQLTFAAGATGSALTQTVEVGTVEDSEDEGAETFTMTLSVPDQFPSGTPYSLPAGVELGTSAAAGTIEDAAVVAVRRLSRVNEEVLPRVAEAIASSALSAITGRIASVTSGSARPASGLAGRLGIPGAPGFGERPDGQSGDAFGSGLPAIPGTEGRALGRRASGKVFPGKEISPNREALPGGETPVSMERVLGGSSFVLPLNAAGSRSGVDSLAVWGSGDWRGLSSPDDRTLEWDGRVLSFHIGADARVRPDLLAGLSVSRSLGSFDYTDRDPSVTVKGDYESRMTGVHPYVSWTPSGDFSLWIAAGYGQGEIEITEAGEPGRSSDTELRMAALGGSHRLLADEGIFPDGTATLSLKGEGSAASVKVKGDGGEIEPLTSSARRFRLSLEGGYECRSGSGWCLAPSVEIGVRHDSGDGITGTGMELGGGLLYTDPSMGLTMQGRGRVLILSGEDGQKDWGFGGLVRIDPGASGLGLSFSLAPGFGDVASGISRLYAQGVDGAASSTTAPAGRLEAELGYGFATSPGVVLTPYTNFSLAGGGSRNYRVGGRLKVEPSLVLSLEGERRESGTGAPGHGVMLRGQMHW